MTPEASEAWSNIKAAIERETAELSDEAFSEVVTEAAQMLFRLQRQTRVLLAAQLARDSAEEANSSPSHPDRGSIR